MTTLEAVRPYVEQLLDDSEVRRHDRRRRRGAFGLLVLTGAVAYLAVDASARDRAFETLLDVLGRPETDRPA